MKLDRLSIVNFKNIASATCDLAAGLNCFVGENGAGKTNVLDAVHYLSMCKSSLGMTDRGSLRHGEEFFVVEGEYSTGEGRGLKVMCSFAGGAGSGVGSDAGTGTGSVSTSGGSRSVSGSAGGGKKMKCDGKEYERLSDHVGVVPMVMVSPADTFLISDAADERRRWLNAFISQLDRGYLNALVRYNAVLTERNRLLKDAASGRAGYSRAGSSSGYSRAGSGSGYSDSGCGEILDVLDMQLASHGAVVHARRAEIIEKMRPLVGEYYARLSDDREKVEMGYRSECTGREFVEVLAAAREKDLANGFTTSGIHRDDVVMRIGGHLLKKYGSQGQQKSFLVALKLAQFAVVRDALGESPLLLLDDLFDKLDNGRVERLIELVSGSGGLGEGSGLGLGLGSDKGLVLGSDKGLISGSDSVSGKAPLGQVFISDCNRSRLEEVLRSGGREYSLFELRDGEITKL